MKKGREKKKENGLTLGILLGNINLMEVGKLLACGGGGTFGICRF